MNNKNNNRIWEKSGKRTENTSTLFYISLLSDIRRSIGLTNIKDFQIKRKSIKRKLFPKWETKKYKKRNKDKGIKPLPLYLCIIVT
jgi:hypothetical protein